MRRLAVFVLLAALAAAPFALSSHLVYLMALVASTTIMAAGLTVVVGFAGQISIAQATFTAFGAYGAAILADRLGVPVWLGLPLVAAGTAAVGYVFGALALRVEDHYLALATLAVCAVVQLLLVHLEDLTGGAVGLPVPPLVIAGTSFTQPGQLYAVSVPAAVATVWGLHAVLRSRIGRAFAALRLTEIGAASVGISVLHYKSLAFAISAGLGALGGGLLSLQTTYLDPAQFGILESVRLIAIAVIGGLRSPFGPVIGASVFTLLPELLGAFGRYMALVFSLILVAFILASPLGLAGLGRSALAEWLARAARGLRR